MRVLIARKRLSGVQLAKLVGVSQPYLSRRLNGAVPFDLNDLELITDALGVTLEDLLKSAKASIGISPNGGSAHMVRPVSPAPGYGPFGQKPRGSSRPGSSVRRPALIGPGRRPM
ncbi:MAG TPA: helix-turn-helix transcriptional regulator [Solirubrobacterales bacterium]